jgi:hypothetical protein
MNQLTQEITDKIEMRKKGGEGGILADWTAHEVMESHSDNVA